MALTGNWGMFGGRNNSATIKSGAKLYKTAGKDIKSEIFGMAYGLGCTKHMNSSGISF